jgi:kanamycin kinase
VLLGIGVLRGIKMKLTPTTLDLNAVPQELHLYIKNATCFDSSCSPEARVTFIHKDGGYFLKEATKGSLKTESEMTTYFHSKRLAPAVVAYVSGDKDYLLTEKVQGDDCTTAKYTEQPERLCDITAERLAMLHSLDFTDCPVPNHTERYISRAKANYKAGHYDATLFPDNWGYASAEEAANVINTKGHLMQTDTLLHGDYCLPNIILNDWVFSGFIDVDCGGVGDRHVDLFWGIWSLFFNLKTDKYHDRFIDAYGRDKVDEERLRVVAACEVFL